MIRTKTLVGLVAAATLTAGTATIAGGGTCEGDVDGDGLVGISDILAVVSSFGTCPDKDPCDADIDGNGEVGVPDLLAVLMNFGPCDGEPQCETDADCDDGDPCTFDICIQGTCLNFSIPNCE